MWYPPPTMVPMYFVPSSLRFADGPAPAVWPATPVKQYLCFAFNDFGGYQEHCLSAEDGRKFLLSKSVYDLVRENHFLELTDSKLLSWYLSLPAEDRKLIQDEGGFLQFLHRHPALEVFRHVVYLKQHTIEGCCPIPALDTSSKLDGSRQATIYGVSQCVNCGTSSPSDTEMCRCCSTLFCNQGENVCIPEEENSLWLLPNEVRAELNLLGYKGQVREYLAVRSSQQLCCLQSTSTNMSATSSNLSNEGPGQPRNDFIDGKLLCPMWDGKEIQMFKNPLVQARFLLDRKLELQNNHQSSDPDKVPLLPDTNPDFPNLEKEMLPEYYSFNNATVEYNSAQWGDATNISIMATEDNTNNGPMNCGAENSTFPHSLSFLSNSSEWTDLSEDGQNLSSEDEPQADEDHSANKEEASSSAACVSLCSNLSQSTQSDFTCEGGISSSSLSLNVKNTLCEVSPVSLGTSQTVDASSDFRASFTATNVGKHCQDVSTGTDLCPVNQETQTIPRLTSEKCTITEVYMSDLDAICEEFEKFKVMEDELIRLKNESCSAGEPKNEQQQSHCGCDALSRARWAELRLLALQFAMCQQHCWRCFYTSPQGEATFQRIDAVPDAVSEALNSIEEQYLKMKSKILEGVPLDNLKPLSVDTKRLNASTCYRPSLKLIIESATSSKTVISRQSRGMPGSSQQARVSSDAKPGVFEVLNCSDVWIDAEEELRYDERCKLDKQTGQRDQEDSKKRQKVDADRKDPCCLLCVSNLPNAVGEHDLLLWFAKYNTNQVSLSKFSKPRVAIVSMRNPNDVEAAVREMNGRYIQGHALHVEHIHRPPADSQITIKESGIQLSPAAHKAGSTEEEPVPENAHHWSLDKLTNICTTPTATGTCVPQHYGTMGSFDTIMAQLLERHSNMGRQQIVGALLKLQKKHHGVLSGLPLREIVSMTSELLT